MEVYLFWMEKECIILVGLICMNQTGIRVINRFGLLAAAGCARGNDTAGK